MHCYDLDFLTIYMTRAINDAKGPKKLRIIADQDLSLELLKNVFAACEKAGYKKASLSKAGASTSNFNNGSGVTVEKGKSPKEIDLTSSTKIDELFRSWPEPAGDNN